MTVSTPTDLQYMLRDGAVVAAGDLVRASKDGEAQEGPLKLYNGTFFIGMRGGSLKFYEGDAWKIERLGSPKAEPAEPAVKRWHVKFIDRMLPSVTVKGERYTPPVSYNSRALLWVGFTDASGEITSLFAIDSILSIQQVEADD